MSRADIFSNIRYWSEHYAGEVAVVELIEGMIDTIELQVVIQRHCCCDHSDAELKDMILRNTQTWDGRGR